METEVKPHPERRKKDGMTSHIAELVIGRQSRKVAFGIWLFLVSTALLKLALIDSGQWIKCVYLCTLLIGFGTIADSVLEKIGDQVAGTVAKKINTVVKVETTTDVTPAS